MVFFSLKLENSSIAEKQKEEKKSHFGPFLVKKKKITLHMIFKQFGHFLLVFYFSFAKSCEQKSGRPILGTVPPKKKSKF